MAHVSAWLTCVAGGVVVAVDGDRWVLARGPGRVGGWAHSSVRASRFCFCTLLFWRRSINVAVQRRETQTAAAAAQGPTRKSSLHATMSAYITDRWAHLAPGPTGHGRGRYGVRWEYAR